ncbi:MAG TPA: DUF4389 domain-containing protein [Actinomycetales bacterium]|nr:DUF4389 domain-containing protein [Actinomycetales bacterium]
MASISTYPPPAYAAPSYPVHVEAVSQPVASRWLWLVKWLLAIPHYFVLVFLWIAFTAVSVIAFFAILFTGRYPRGLFEFNVGVLRWSWRVAYYSYGALATDRYPPFTLNEVDDYPAHLRVDYPEHLSRGLVLVKWWLLAIPHYIVTGIFVGSGVWAVREANNPQNWQWVWGGGLIGILVLVAAVVLLVTGTYPRTVYDLLLGVNRWVLRVAAYVSLMTDEYPPFRLDMGGPEPSPALLMPTGPTAPGYSATATSGTPAADAPTGAPQEGTFDRAVGPPASSAAGPPPTTSGPGPGPGSGPVQTYGQVQQPPGQQQPPPSSVQQRWTTGRVVGLVVGILVLLLGFGLISAGTAGLIADRNVRDGGYLVGPTQRMTSPGYAVVSEDVIINTPGVTERLPENIVGRLRITVTPLDQTRPVFVGVASLADADRYLAGVTRTTGWSGSNDNGVLQQGTSPAAPPQSAGIWDTQASGLGRQNIMWTPRSGDWSLVVMNADASAGVANNIRFDATVPWLRTLGFVALGIGVLFLAGGAVLIAVVATRASRGSQAPGSGSPSGQTQPTNTEPTNTGGATH